MDTVILNDASNELIELLGNEFEAFTRQKDGKYNQFLRIVINKASKADDSTKQNIKDSIDCLLQNNYGNMLKDTTKILKKLQLFNSVFGAANLCATVTTFAITYQKLNEIRNQINDVINNTKNSYVENILYKFDCLIGNYNQMLDKKECGELLDEEKYLDLIKEEYALLNQLKRSFLNETCNNPLQILQTILILISMMKCTIEDFDFIYRYNHTKKETLHGDHIRWENLYNDFLTEGFTKKLQDLFFIDSNYSEYETDILIDGVQDEIRDLKSELLDFDNILLKIEKRESFIKVQEKINLDVFNEIQKNINTLDTEEENDNLVSLCKESVNELNLIMSN